MADRPVPRRGADRAKEMRERAQQMREERMKARQNRTPPGMIEKPAEDTSLVKQNEQVVVPESEKIIGEAVATTSPDADSPEAYRQKLDEVMVRATEEALAQGITDSDKLREFKLAARAAFKEKNKL